MKPVKIEYSELEELVIGTLSFYEPMTLSQIILDFDSEQIRKFPNFTKEELALILQKFEKKKLIKKQNIDKEIGWIKIQAKRSWFNRLLLKLTKF